MSEGGSLLRDNLVVSYYFSASIRWPKKRDDLLVGLPLYINPFCSFVLFLIISFIYIYIYNILYSIQDMIPLILVHQYIHTIIF